MMQFNSPITIMLIKDILAIDSQFRSKGLTDKDDLHTIGSLVSDKSLDYDLPTLGK